MRVNPAQRIKIDMKKLLHILGLALLFSILFTGVGFAQGGTPPTDDEVNAIAHKLYCPVCESTPLDVCPTDACKDWRQLIRTMLSDGKTEDQILQHFVDQYGDKVLAQPPHTGLNWLIYILPPAIILAGAILLLRSLREWTKPKTAGVVTAQEGSQAASDDYVARLEEELKKRK
jgi:cytochrome c-type biogenesis protein CcmH